MLANKVSGLRVIIVECNCNFAAIHKINNHYIEGENWRMSLTYLLDAFYNQELKLKFGDINFRAMNEWIWMIDEMVLI